MEDKMSYASLLSCGPYIPLLGVNFPCNPVCDHKCLVILRSPCQVFCISSKKKNFLWVVQHL